MLKGLVTVLDGLTCYWRVAAYIHAVNQAGIHLLADEGRDGGLHAPLDLRLTGYHVRLACIPAHWLADTGGGLHHEV